MAAMKTGHGAISFIYEYRYGGKPKRLTFKGARTVEMARELAFRANIELLAGRDPGAQPEPVAAVKKTLRQMCEEYFKERGDFLSRKEYERTLENHIYPLLGNREYESIVKDDLKNLKRSIIAKLTTDPEKPAGHHAAKAALKVLNTVWAKYAKDEVSNDFRWPVVISPLQDLKKDENGNGNGRALSSAEVRALWLAAGDCGIFGSYVRFLFLTGLRRTAAATLRIEQLHNGILAVEGSSTKPPYELPLSAEALALLDSVRRDGSPWLFSLNGDGPLVCYSRVKNAIQARAKLNSDWHLHLIRHTVRSLLSELTTPDIAERSLGHVIGGIRGTYDHFQYREPIRSAMNALAARLLAITAQEG